MATLSSRSMRKPSVASSRHSRFQERSFGYLLLLLPIGGFAVFGVYPLFEVFRLSLFKINRLSGTEQFVGLDNFQHMLNDEAMPTILLNTLVFVVLLSVSGTVLALALAILVNTKLRGIELYRAAIFLPALITMVAWTLIWQFILQPDGLLDGVLKSLGASTMPWLRSHWITLVILVVIQLLKNVGLNMMILLAALQAVPQELIDAARVDGARKWRAFRHIVIPEISPAILMVFMIMLVGSFKVFDQIYLLTRGGPGYSTTVLSYYVYEKAFIQNDFGYASAVAVLLFVIVLILTVLVWRARRRFVAYE